MKWLSPVLLVLVLVPRLAMGDVAEDDCRTTRIDVELRFEPDEEVVRGLYPDYGPKGALEWHDHVERRILEILSEYEPEMRFASSANADAFRPHFMLRFIIVPGVGYGEKVVEILRGSNELWPELEGFYTEPDYDSPHDEYKVWATLAAHSSCVPPHLRCWGLTFENAHHRELEQAIKNVVSLLNLARTIAEFEAEHQSPPRDPTLYINLARDYVSPVDEESRRVEVYGRVHDCRGHEVCDPRGHPIYYQFDSDEVDFSRLQLRISRENAGGQRFRGVMTILTNKKCVTTGIYELTRGTDGTIIPIHFTTCQLGLAEPVAVTKDLVVRGLLMKITAFRDELSAGETTDITVSLLEVEPSGTQYPVEGREIVVTGDGIVDGGIQAPNGYRTDGNGQVVLRYHAGEHDKSVHVRGSFRPEKYPDQVQASLRIAVRANNVLYLKYRQEGAAAAVGGETLEYWFAANQLRGDGVYALGPESVIVDLSRETHSIVRHGKGEYVQYSLDMMGEAIRKGGDEATELLKALNIRFDMNVEGTSETQTIDGYECRKYIGTLDYGPASARTEYWVTQDIDTGELAFDQIQKYLFMAGMRATDPIDFGDMVLELMKLEGLLVFSRTEVRTSWDNPGAPPRVSTMRLLEAGLLEPAENLFSVPAGYVRVEK